MPSYKSTHIVVDLKTGLAYGLELDGSGKCLRVQALDTVIESPDTGKLVQKFSSAAGPLSPGKLPVGETIYAVELTGSTKIPGQMFTINFSETAGEMPSVARKSLPDDFAKAGLAPTVLVNTQSEAGFKQAMDKINKLTGLDTAKLQVRKHAAEIQFEQAQEELGILAEKSSHHMILQGHPGTGKTTFARLIAEAYFAAGIIKENKIVEVKREDLVAGYVGQTALKVAEQLKKAKGGVLFIDEGYSLARAGHGNDNDFGQEVVETLVGALENIREHTIVIIAGYKPEMQRLLKSNPGMASRFPTVLDFEDFTKMQLGQIFDSMTAERGFTISPEVREYALHYIENQRAVKGEHFANAREVRTLIEKVRGEHAYRLLEEGVFARKDKIPRKEYERKIRTITLDEIKSIPLDDVGSVRTPVGYTRKNDLAA